MCVAKMIQALQEARRDVVVLHHAFATSMQSGMRCSCQIPGQSEYLDSKAVRVEEKMIIQGKWDGMLLHLCQETKIATILLGQLDQVRSKSLGSFLFPFLVIERSITIGVSAREDAADLFLLQVSEAQSSKCFL